MSEKRSSKVAARPLDVTNASRGVWLIKVPNYLSDAWMKAGPNAELGVMRDSS